MTLSPCDTTPAQNKLSRHHHDMAWHHMTWKRHSARHGMTWHGITLLDITTWHDIWWHGSPQPLRYHASTKQVVASSWHGMTWHGITLLDITTWHDLWWPDKTRQGITAMAFFTHTHTHFRVIQSELTCIIAACGLSQHPALDEDRSRHQTSNLR